MLSSCLRACLPGTIQASPASRVTSRRRRVHAAVPRARSPEGSAEAGGAAPQHPHRCFQVPLCSKLARFFPRELSFRNPQSESQRDFYLHILLGSFKLPSFKQLCRENPQTHQLHLPWLVLYSLVAAYLCVSPLNTRCFSERAAQTPSPEGWGSEFIQVCLGFEEDVYKHWAPRSAAHTRVPNMGSRREGRPCPHPAGPGPASPTPSQLPPHQGC